MTSRKKVPLVLSKQKSQIRIVVHCAKCFANKMKMYYALANLSDLVGFVKHSGTKVLPLAATLPDLI